MKLIKSSFFLLICIALAYSCKKQDDSVPSVADTYWQATSGSGSVSINGISLPPMQYTEEMMAKSGLNVWFWLNANGKVFVDTIRPTGLKASLGTWSQNSDKISLILDSSTSSLLPIKSTVATLSDNSLLIPFSLTYQGSPLNVTLVCTKR